MGLNTVALGHLFKPRQTGDTSSEMPNGFPDDAVHQIDIDLTDEPTRKTIKNIEAEATYKTEDYNSWFAKYAIKFIITCGICGKKKQVPDRSAVRACVQCGHPYCADCLFKIQSTSRKCPMCRFQ